MIQQGMSQVIQQAGGGGDHVIRQTIPQSKELVITSSPSPVMEQSNGQVIEKVISQDGQIIPQCHLIQTSGGHVIEKVISQGGSHMLQSSGGQVIQQGNVTLS